MRVIDLIFSLKSGCFGKEEDIQKKLNLSPSEFNGLLILTNDNSIPCSLFSKKMGLSVSRGSRVIDKLIQNGYVAAESKSDDRRIIKIKLTPRGRKTRGSILKSLEECEKEISKSFSSDDIDKLHASLDKIVKILIRK
jgi:MarR family transcriptional regulator, organic hydroperoxide resistance regulator